MLDGSIFIVAGSISAKTGVAPAWMIELTVEQKVMEVVITSSPSFKSRVIKLKCNAAVQELTAMAY